MSIQQQEGEKFPLVRGEKLFESSGDVLQDLYTLEGSFGRLAIVMRDTDLSNTEVVDALEQLLWRASGTFGSNAVNDESGVSSRLHYIFEDMRKVCEPLRRRI